jgi:NAD+ synthase (glutamine-hydrolysing)
LNRIRLGAAALNQTPMDWDSNAQHIRAALDAARDAGVGILCLPELCITGYGCEDMFFASGIQRRALEILSELVPDTHGIVTCIGLPVYHDGGVYNAAAVACDGRLLGFVAKQRLAGDGIHYEPRWFRRWPAGVVSTIEVGDQAYPIGDLLFDCGDVRIGLEICRDAWVADRTGARLAQRGADVLLNPSASHFAFAKQLVRERFVLEGSRAFCVSYAYCNLLGNEAGRSIYDGGTLIASGGKMLVRGPRFSFADWLLATAVIDVDGTRRLKAESFPEVTGAKLGDEDGSVSSDFEYPHVAEPVGSVTTQSSQPDGVRVPGHPQWETGARQKEEEFTRSVALALCDYIRKSRMQGFVVSLSGGADSTTVAVLVHLLVQFGRRELGVRGIVDKLSHISGLSEIAQLAQMSTDKSPAVEDEEIVKRLLTCVYQATRNSGAKTLAAARAAAEAVGAEFLLWNVDGIVDTYVETVAKAVGRVLTWERDDISLQNIQARARGPGAWLLANLRGALLLTTSNRSEAAAGYATMDGDTCGGLAPLAGIDKAFLLDWLKWMETTGPAGIGPLPQLAVVNRLRPTAELRPPAASQTDEADLMPYRVLDAIERAAIRDKLMPVEVFQAVWPMFPQYGAEQMAAWVERFFRLWCRNQWKRERYAPSFHLDDENLDPKTWCRFPILNSGFERELKELREYVRGIGGSGATGGSFTRALDSTAGQATGGTQS